jgi:hypothetical protein
MNLLAAVARPQVMAPLGRQTNHYFQSQRGNMRSFIRIAIFFTIACSLPSIVSTQSQRGPSTTEERATAVKTAKLLESDPFGKDSKKMRQWFTLWLIEVPDITVEACTAYFGPGGEKKYKYSGELLTQTMFSGAAFIIEHPESASDRVAVNLAGVEGTLRMYTAMVRTEPKARHEFLDQLVAKQERGELRSYVEDIGKTACNSKK